MEATALTKEILDKYRSTFYQDSKNILAQNVCSRIDPFDVCLVRKQVEQPLHIFQHKVESEGKPVTNQKNSGRCWLFAALNCMRIPLMKSLNIDEFEFSQAYLFFWDKIERSNFFLNNIVETAKRNEPIDGRLVSFLLNDPISDGGQWDMLVNLINKHGLIPKKCFPETFSCEQSVRLNAILKSKLREFAKELRDMAANDSTDEELQAKIDKQMSTVYRVVGICLGIPNDTFTWEYYDKSKNYQSIGPITPLEFYTKYVKPVYNVDDKICLVNDPRENNKFGQAYTIDLLGNVVGGRPIIYNNQPIELLMKLAAESIKNGEAVWFGCEVVKRLASKPGIEDLDIHNFKLVFGTDIQLGMTKADRLLYGESMMSHAMVFTGVSFKGKEVTKFRVENSWGEDRGEKGYFMMTGNWFKEFVFELVVDKKYVTKEVLDVQNKPPIVLPAWDPMGTLAN